MLHLPTGITMLVKYVINNASLSSTPAMSSKQKIAIVGIGCRFAGGIENVEQFWQVRILKTYFSITII